MSLAKRRCRPRKNARTLAARLLLAGAATGVDMVGGPLQPESNTHTSTRQPLPLVPDHRLPSPPAVFRIRRCQYVDPRKVHPLSSASFQFAPPSVHEALPVSGKRALKPVTAWKPDREQILRGSPCIVRPKVVPKPAERSTAIPLVLAPAMNGDIKDRKGPCQPKPLAKLERKPPSPQAEIRFGPFVPPSPKHAAPPSAIGLLPCAAVIRMPPSPLETSTELTCDSLTSPLRCSPPLTKTRDGYVATLSEELDTDPKDGSPSYTSGIKPYPVLANAFLSSPRGR
ncbi:hypothetical protein BC628DRAFT_17077 [Trametes gibbosa]|nr:hypothetical protein BC628DRAFT_17077 [Trametes gibbosa]